MPADLLHLHEGHGRTREECHAILGVVAAEAGITDPADRATLCSSGELRRMRLVYSTDRFLEWQTSLERSSTPSLG